MKNGGKSLFVNKERKWPWIRCKWPKKMVIKKGPWKVQQEIGQAQRSPPRNQSPRSSSLVKEEWRRHTMLQKVLKLWNWNWLIYRKRFEGPQLEEESKRRKILGRVSEFTHLKKRKKKKNIYTTFKKKSQQEKLLLAQGTFKMYLSQPWTMGPSLMNSNCIWSTTFYKEKMIKILSDVGSRKTKQEWKEEKRPTKLLQIHGRKPWLIQQTKDYTILRNWTIPTIKEHQSRREREEEKNWASKICTI